MTFSKQQLKTIAIIAMIINHIGHVFYPDHVFLQFIYLSIGLITFPTMAYMLVEGFRYTKNIKKYIFRMFSFWILSILPFHWAFEPYNHINPLNNIFATLTLSLIMLYLCDKSSDKVQYLIVFWVACLTLISDWGFIGPIFIYCLYKKINITQTIITYLLPFTTVSFMGSDMSIMPVFVGYALVNLLLYKYDPNKKYNPSYKNFFYWIYPIHLLVVVLIRNIIT